MLDCGGLPRGRIVELFGPPGSGKTTFGLLWSAAAQRGRGTAVYIDLERSLTSEWADACGVDRQDLVVVQPAGGEEALSILESLLTSFGVDLVVVDSAAALEPDTESAALEDVPADAHTGLLFRHLRRVQLAAQRSRACVLFLNQTRMSPNSETRTAGGRALGLYAALRVRITPGVALYDSGGQMAGQRLKLDVVKNKLGEPWRQAEVDLRGAIVTAVDRKGPARQGLAAAARAVSG